jgi:hypothetical protein
LNLEPYGTDAGFVKECTGCHEPVRGNDFVYTLPIAAVTTTRQEVVNNRAAALPAALPWQPLAWGAITMSVDPTTGEMATLFGNDAALNVVRSVRGSGAGRQVAYPAGAVLALVTWGQRDDPHWFGARISNAPRSIEFLQIESGAIPAVPQIRRRWVDGGRHRWGCSRTANEVSLESLSR